MDLINKLPVDCFHTVESLSISTLDPWNYLMLDTINEYKDFEEYFDPDIEIGILERHSLINILPSEDIYTMHEISPYIPEYYSDVEFVSEIIGFDLAHSLKHGFKKYVKEYLNYE